jgi:hypothetical protein
MGDLFDFSDEDDRYPNRPGYVRGSDTSAAAADSLDDKKLTQLRGRVYAHVKALAAKGATCDEVEVAMNLPHQTASARLRELQLGGFVHINQEKRKTRSGRAAHVYFAVRA